MNSVPIQYYNNIAGNAIKHYGFWTPQKTKRALCFLKSALEEKLPQDNKKYVCKQKNLVFQEKIKKLNISLEKQKSNNRPFTQNSCYIEYRKQTRLYNCYVSEFAKLVLLLFFSQNFFSNVSLNTALVFAYLFLLKTAAEAAGWMLQTREIPSRRIGSYIVTNVRDVS